MNIFSLSNQQRFPTLPYHYTQGREAADSTLAKEKSAIASVNNEVGNESSSDEDQNKWSKSNTIQETLRRNRGPRPAYSDANMQHSLGYLP